jgi:hypothetical protein
MKFGYLILFIAVMNSGILSARPGQSDKKKDDEKLKKIMILFLGKNYENRKSVEGELTYYINDKGFDALPSSKYIPGIGLPNKETVISALEDNDFDGILIVQVVDLNVKQKWVNAKMKYGNSTIAPVFLNYYDLSLQYTPGYSTQEISYEVESTLFRLSDKAAVFTTTSEAYDQESLDLAMESFAQSTADQLKRSKTLLKTK